MTTVADIGRAFAALSLIVALQVENGAEPAAGGTSRPEQHITGEGILYQGKMHGAGYRTSAPQAGARLDGESFPRCAIASKATGLRSVFHGGLTPHRVGIEAQQVQELGRDVGPNR
jgi:hypothetical protein